MFGGLLPVWYTTASWIPAQHYIWEICSENWWDAPKTATPAASIGQKGPNSPWQRLTAHHTTNASKAERIGLRSVTSSAIFTSPLANRLPLLQASLQLSARKMLPQQQEADNLSRVHQIPKRCFLCFDFKAFMLLETLSTDFNKSKQTYFSLGKCVDCSGS